jgi:hypothetical protein
MWYDSNIVKFFDIGEMKKLVSQPANRVKRLVLRY